MLGGGILIHNMSLFFTTFIPKFQFLTRKSNKGWKCNILEIHLDGTLTFIMFMVSRQKPHSPDSPIITSSQIFKLTNELQ